MVLGWISGDNYLLKTAVSLAVPPVWHKMKKQMRFEQKTAKLPLG